MLSQPLHDSGPAAPVALAIESDPPAAPLAITFGDDPPGPAAVTEPEPAPVHTPRFALPPDPEPWAEATPAPTPAPAPAIAAAPEPDPTRARTRPRTRPPTPARLLAWSLDALAISALLSACIALALHKAHIRYPLDFVRDTAPLWLALLAALSLAYSWAFTALAGRTPGMALAGHGLRSTSGGPPTPLEALARAVLALPSFALGLSGFVLALFDARGQTLHDKLCRCVVLEEG